MQRLRFHGAVEKVTPRPPDDLGEPALIYPGEVRDFEDALAQQLLADANSGYQLAGPGAEPGRDLDYEKSVEEAKVEPLRRTRREQGLVRDKP